MRKWLSKLLVVLGILSVLFFLADDKSRGAAKIQGYQALKVFAQAGSRRLPSEFESFETEHFIIRYESMDGGSFEGVAAVLERSYEAVGKAYRYYPQGKTVVFIYGSQQEMWDYQRAVRGQAVIGLYNMGIIHILSPDAYLEKTGDQMAEFEKNGPVLHEYTHLVIDEMSGGNVELWFTEGLALYEEFRVNGAEWAPGYAYDRYYESRELRQQFAYLEENRAYRQSFDMVRALIEKHGKEKIIALLYELKSGYGFDQAFSKVYGFSADSFIDGFSGTGQE